MCTSSMTWGPSGHKAQRSRCVLDATAPHQCFMPCMYMSQANWVHTGHVDKGGRSVPGGWRENHLALRRNTCRIKRRALIII